MSSLIIGHAYMIQCMVSVKTEVKVFMIGISVLTIVSVLGLGF